MPGVRLLMEAGLVQGEDGNPSILHSNRSIAISSVAVNVNVVIKFVVGDSDEPFAITAWLPSTVKVIAVSGGAVSGSIKLLLLGTTEEDGSCGCCLWPGCDGKGEAWNGCCSSCSCWLCWYGSKIQLLPSPPRPYN